MNLRWDLPLKTPHSESPKTLGTRLGCPADQVGGSAVTVACRDVSFSLGSDTGGSIRQPAAFCGVSGLKPSYGRVSRYGLVAFASSLDQIGPFAESAEDIAYILNAICGHDKKDSTSVQTPPIDFTATLNQDIKGKRIGLPVELFNDKIDGSVMSAVQSAITQWESMGAIVEKVTIPSFELALSTYYILAPAEASANLARFDGVRYGLRDKTAANLRDMIVGSRGKGFGKEVQRRIILGTFVLSSGYYDAYYLKAQKARTLIQRDFADIFTKCDVIVTPTTPSTPFKFGEKTQDPLSMYLADLATIPVNLAGLPAMSIPCGFAEGLPVGVQLIGKPFDEASILQFAHQYQAKTDYHRKTPPVGAAHV